MTKDPTLEARLREATAAAQRQQLDEAERLLDEVLETDPDNVRAHDLYGFVRFFQGRPAEAEQHCRRVLALEPEHAYAWKGLGLCLARQGRVDEGMASLEQAIGLQPRWFDPYWDLAVVCLDAGRLDEALSVVERGQRAVPDKSQRFDGLVAKIKKSMASG